MAWLTSRVHPAKLKSAIDTAEFGLKRFFGKVLYHPTAHVKPEVEKLLHGVGLAAYSAGSDYARSFFPLTKLGYMQEHDYSQIIHDFLSRMDAKLPRSTIDAVQDSLDRGAGLPVEELEGKTGYESSKTVARSVLMNVYVMGALKQWSADGITHVKRVAMEDNRVCPVCVGLNGKEYSIAEISALPNPQNFDTHIGCRCIPIPIIGVSTKSKGQEIHPDFRKDIRVGKNEAAGVPIEYVGVLEDALRGSELPFKVRFDPKLKPDYELKGGVLRINPKTLADEDPREIIFAEAAQELWDKNKERVELEYRPLVEQGFAKSVRSWDTTHELFVQNFVGWRLGQLDEDLWSQVFFRGLS